MPDRPAHPRAAFAELSDLPKALTTLRAASAVDADPNTWFGIALTLSRQENLALLSNALTTLDTCFRVSGERRKFQILSVSVGYGVRRRDVQESTRYGCDALGTDCGRVVCTSKAVAVLGRYLLHYRSVFSRCRRHPGAAL